MSVEVEPKQQVVDYGRPANFKCNYKGNPVKSIGWMKNGEDLGHSDPVLRINSVKKEDRGMYQCFVRNDQVRRTKFGSVLQFTIYRKCKSNCST